MNCRCDSVTALHGRQGQDYEVEHLEELAIDSKNWTALFRCPSTGRLWKKYFPYPSMHGGGPPSYEQISQDLAASEFPESDLSIK